MEFLIIAIIVLSIGILLGYIFDFNLKKIKQLGENQELDDIVKKYPNNKDVAKYILHKLNNDKVKIQENKDSESSMYIAISDKIIIGNVQKSYTRIQTIAHECLHSIQSRKLLLFHFVFSNFYILYFVIIAILGILKMISYESVFLCIFILIAMVFYSLRIYLENDAMIKAQFLAKEYIQEKQISSEEEIEKLIEGYEKLNKVGIKAVNYKLLFDILVKIFLLCIIFLIF